MVKNLKTNLSAADKWVRLAFMALFALLIYWVIFSLIWVVAIFQFLYVLFAGEPSKTVAPFAHGLSEYVKQITAFLMYSSEVKPFPFSPWPIKSIGNSASEDKLKAASKKNKQAEAND